MFLISTKGKTPQQIKDEGWAAFQKYQRVARASTQQLLAEGKITEAQAIVELSQLRERPKERLDSLKKVNTQPTQDQQVECEISFVNIKPREQTPQNQESEIFFVNRKPDQPSQLPQTQPQDQKQERELTFLPTYPKQPPHQQPEGLIQKIPKPKKGDK